MSLDKEAIVVGGDIFVVGAREQSDDLGGHALGKRA